MTSRAQDICGEALTLTAPERVDVAAELLANVDDGETDTAEIEAVWAAETEKRACRVLAGEPALRERRLSARRSDIRKP